MDKGSDRVYDVIILGGGPAGLSAGLYAGRGGLSALIVEMGQPGGQIANTAAIENYPGQTEGDSGESLSARMRDQAAAFGAAFVRDEAVSVRLEGDVKEIAGRRGVYAGRSVIIAAGASPKQAGCRNEEHFTGRGVSYCATCDAPFFRDREVFVIGGGDAAAEEAIYLTHFARQVTLVHRRDALRAAKHIRDKALSCPKLKILWNTVVEQAGEAQRPMLDRLTLRDTQTGRVWEHAAEDGVLGLFVFIGLAPNTGLFRGLLPMEDGYLVTGADMSTPIPGVFAAGDVRNTPLRQVVTAVADGAVAAVSAERYLARRED